MKFAGAVLVALTALAAVQSRAVPEFGNGPLHDDIQYFLDMIPHDKVAGIILRYLAEDKEFQEAVAYTKTEAFKQMMVEIENIPEFINFVNYLENNGVYAYSVLNKLNSWLGIDLPKPPMESREVVEFTGGLGGLFEEVKALISYDKFIHGYVYKMKNSPAFRGFIAELKSPNFQEMIYNLYANDIFQQLHHDLTSKGVKLGLIEDIMYVVLGISFPGQGEQALYDAKSDLVKDLEDFANLAITPEVVDTFLRYSKNDKQVQNAFAYMHTTEFHEMVRAVEAMKEYQQLVLYMENAGVPMIEAIKQTHEVIGMEDYVPPKPVMYFSLEDAQATGGIKAMVDEMLALMPRQQLRELFQEKLKTSKAFADFIKQVSSPEFQKIVNAVYTHQVFLEMREKALKAGLDLKAIEELAAAILGIYFPKP